MYGLFINNLWRDEKNGKSYFRMKTKYDLFMDAMYTTKEVIRNKRTGEDENWYTVIVNAVDISIPVYKKNSPIRISGYFKPLSNPDAKWEFVTREVVEASNDESITIKYLTSDAFPEITEDIAEKIVGNFGADIHSFVRTSRTACSQIMEVTGLERESVIDIMRIIEETSIEMEVFSILNKAEIPYPYCVKAVKLYGKNAINKLKKYPYKTGFKIGLSFVRCDKLSKTSGGNAFDTGRLKFACQNVIEMFSKQGHIYTPIEIFKKAIEKTLKNNVFDEYVSAVNVIAVMGDNYALERINGVNCIYSKLLVAAEKRVVENIKRLATNTPEPYDNSLIEYASKICNISYGKQQIESFPRILSRRGVNILTGGPGTGKTTNIKGLILAYQRMHPEHIIKLCAPTGRAAQKLSESTGMPAATIHRLLDYKPYGENVSYKDANDPIEADLIIVDEMSMTDVLLFDILLEAIKTGTSVILVGDIHQLESVGPGAVLHDLLKAPETVIRKSLLTEVFRQKGESLIIDNSERINNGITDLVEGNDFKIITTKSEEESLKEISELYLKLYKKDAPFDIQILCPAKSGLTGVNNLNSVLHELLNPEGKTLVYGRNKFRVNDKIIMTRNNALIDYYNGDIGCIVKIEEHGLVVEIRGNEITLSRDMLDDVSLAFAMTTHKSQGSEFSTVIAVMPMEPKNMLVRNLFYTAVTRAKVMVYIINEASAMQTAIKVNNSGNRRTLMQNYF